MINRDAIEKRLRSALRASLKEVQKDPKFVAQLAKAVAEEMGLDPMVSTYISLKLQERLKEKKDEESRL